MKKTSRDVNGVNLENGLRLFLISAENKKKMFQKSAKES
jgi:hypothetical protein